MNYVKRFSVSINFFKKNIKSIILIILYIDSLLIISTIFRNITTSHMYLYHYLMIAVFFLSTILVILEYKERRKISSSQHEFHAQDEYVRNMETIIDMARKERHEFANHLNTLQAICVLNKPDAVIRIKTYLEKLTNNMVLTKQMLNTGNDYIDGLLTMKIDNASKYGVSIETDFQALLDTIDINDSDLISVFGNLIDNAFDALKDIQNSHNKNINISTYIDRNSFYIEVSNNGPVIQPKHLNSIFESGFSTKSNKKERGYGLYITRQIIIENDGDIKVESTLAETRFIVRFNLYKG